MSNADYFRALFVVLIGGVALCLTLMSAIVLFYAARCITRKEERR